MLHRYLAHTYEVPITTLYSQGFLSFPGFFMRLTFKNDIYSW